MEQCREQETNRDKLRPHFNRQTGVNQRSKDMGH